MIPLILHEDADLLVVNKPPGWNTHAPSPYAGEGVYDWLRHREPRWAGLAIIHRLDRATSGVLVFAKTPRANRSLTAQFTERQVEKRYRLATRSAVDFTSLTVNAPLKRLGERYVVAPGRRQGAPAETRFEVVAAHEGLTQLVAFPLTGRTHQIRVHAAARGFPVLGDVLYGGAPADRLWLHAEQLALCHPATGKRMTFEAPADFNRSPERALREAIIDPAETDAWRWLHSAAEALGRLAGEGPRSEFQVDHLGAWLLAQCRGTELTGPQAEYLRAEASRMGLAGVYHQPRPVHIRGRATEALSPRLVLGEPAPAAFPVRENGIRFELRFSEGSSVGLFLDQRDNRRRLIANHVASGFPLFPAGAAGASVLNTFAYTCGFSVCAAQAGARVASVDLSRKYLDWGRRNFALNGLDPAKHEFIHGDVFDWLARLARKGRRFDLVLLDPPTFSTSKAGGVFRVEKDYGRLAVASAALVRSGGVLFASANAADWAPEAFLEQVKAAITERGRRIVQEHYAPQPPDFPVLPSAPAHLKTVWLRLDGGWVPDGTGMKPEAEKPAIRSASVSGFAGGLC